MKEIVEKTQTNETAEVIDDALKAATSDTGEFDVDKFLEKIKNSDLNRFDVSNEEMRKKLKELVIPDNELDEHGLPIVKDEDIKYIDLFSQYKSKQQQMVIEMIQSIKLMLNETDNYIATEHFNTLSEEEKNKIFEFKEKNILILKNIWHSVKEFKDNIKPKINELIKDISQKNLNELSLFILKDKSEEINKKVTNDGELLYLLNIILESYKTKSFKELLQEIVFNSDEYYKAAYNYSRIILKSIRNEQNNDHDEDNKSSSKQTQVIMLFQNFINELFGIIYNYFNKLDNDPLSKAILFKNSEYCGNSFFTEIIRNNEEFFKYVYDETYDKSYKLNTKAKNIIITLINDLENRIHLANKNKNESDKIINFNTRLKINTDIMSMFDISNLTIQSNIIDVIDDIKFKTPTPFIMTRLSVDLLFKYVWDLSNYLYESGVNTRSYDSPIYYLISLITHQFTLLTTNYKDKEIIDSINLNMYHKIDIDIYLTSFFNYFRELFTIAYNIKEELLYIE